MGKLAKKLLALVLATAVITPLFSGITFTEVRAEGETEPVGAVLSMKPFIGSMYTGTAYEEYLEKHKIEVVSARTKSGAWSGSDIESILQIDNSYWETGSQGSSSNRNWVDVTLAEVSDIGRILFAGRQNPLKGFPTGYKIWVSEAEQAIETSAEDNPEWHYVGAGTGNETTDYQEITLPKETRGKTFRFEWTSWYNTGMSAARIILPIKADEDMGDDGEETAPIISSDSLVMTSFVGNGLTGEVLTDYKEEYTIPVLSARTNGGQYNNSVGIENIITDNNNHWEARSEGNTSNPHWVDITLEKKSEIGRLVYGARNDGAPNKGFPASFKIYVSDRPNPSVGIPAADNEDWKYVGSGAGSPTTSMREIVLPENVVARTIRFEWASWYNTGMSAGRYLMPYKSDTLGEEISALFTDAACSSLASGVTAERIHELEAKVENYISPELYRPYISIAGMLLVNQDSNETIHKVVTLSQRGHRGEERQRTDICTTLGNFDLTGYYVRPGDTVQVFCNTDVNSNKKPRIVFATLNRNHGSDKWYGGYDGMELSKGLNTFTIPENRGDCYAIYFYNPALPAEQAFAPVVRLVGGHQYPVYYFDSKLDPSVNKKNEEEFIAYLTEYCTRVADYTADALAGRGEANFAEYWSDKIIISASARGCLASLNDKTVWSRGQVQTAIAENWYKYGTVKENAIEFMGPAACMEAYEELFDILQNYSGFNTTNPAHPDYRNHNQFLFRAYANGAGAGWAQAVFSGYNAGTVPDGNKLDSGWYRSLFTPSAVFNAGWTEYHEIGHVFDNASIGTSESTNNLYGLYAGTKFLGENRLDGGENRWYNHFTSYINTGVLPDNDLLFYPGAVIWQLNAVDFSATKLYNAPEDAKLSNYGMACRYYRTHKAELDAAFGNDKDSKLVVSFSMACGIDLSSHFEYYQRPVSDRAKRMISGLSKETRNTWYVNDRTFKGGAFSEEDKAATWEATYEKDENGVVTITAPNDVFNEANLQCFEVTKYELDAEGDPTGDEIFVGISGEDKSTAKTELYTIIDRNIVPGARYRYTVKAYDNTLIPSNNPATFDYSASEDTQIPLVKMLINNGDEGMTMNMGNTYKLKLNYYPLYTTEDLNSIEWWVTGYGRDGDKTQGGEDIIMLKDDPDYPGDPTRKMITGVQPGQTHVYVKFGGLTRNHRIVINGGGTEYKNFTFAMPDSVVNLGVGDKYVPRVTRMDNVDNQTVFIRATNPKIQIRSTDESIVRLEKRVTSEKDNTPVLEAIAVAPGTANLELYYDGEKRCEMTVNIAGESVPLESIEIVDLSTNQKETYDIKDSIRFGVTYNPGNATISERVKWTSADLSIAKVDSNGVITPIKGGSVEITATIDTVKDGEKVTLTATKTVNITEYVTLQRLSLNHNKIELNAGEISTIEIVAAKVPVEATAVGFVWESSNTNVATVTKSEEDESKAVITAIGSGTCTVSAMLGGKKVSVNVTVIKPIELLDLHFLNRGAGTVTETSETIKIGNSVQFMVETDPVTATELSKIEWSSDNVAVATVRQGLVTGVGNGTAVITGTVSQTSTSTIKTVTVNVKVEENVIPLTGIGLNKANTTLQIGDSDTLSVNLRPVNTTTNTIDEVEWESSNNEIATVNESGIITAVAEGECNITATLGRFSAVCVVTVAREVVPVEGIVLSNDIFSFEMSISETAQVTATVTPEEASQAVYYRVEDTSIATVSQAGVITALSEGNTNLIVTGSGGYSVYATIIVMGHSHIVDTHYTYNRTHHWMKRCTDERCKTNELPENAMYSYEEHDYTLEIADTNTKVSDATEDSPAIYYKSCVCGVISSTETFEYGDRLFPEDPDNGNGDEGQGNGGQSYIPYIPSGGGGGYSAPAVVTVVNISNMSETKPVSREGKLTVDVSGNAAAKEVTLTKDLATEIAKELKNTDNDSETFEIKTKNITIELDSKAMESLANKAAGDVIRIVFEDDNPANMLP